MKKLKIAQIAPPWISVPPKKYGGTELIVSHLTEELVRRGHQVTLFASGDSITKAKLVSAWPKSLYRMGIPWTDALYPLLHALTAFEKAEEFDIVHSHSSYWGLAFSPFIKTSMVTTYHGNFTSIKKNLARRRILEKFKKNNFISISNSQRKPADKINLNFVGTVYNGIDLKEFKFNNKSWNYLAWLGRITESKGIFEAIQVARKAKMVLKIAAKVDKNSQQDVEFYNKKIKPLIDGKLIQYLGEINSYKKNNLLRNAKALLFSIQWDEPFGLVMIEAMACGTPVIAFKRGSVPEVVKHNKTGFIVSPFNKNKEPNIEGLVEAIKKIDQIDRRECRKRVEENFTIKKMVDGYEEIYYKLIGSKTNQVNQKRNYKIKRKQKPVSDALVKSLSGF
ncbi:MAG: glycosyltransferase [Nitrospiraceae bacterium]|nr:glycosyltransferase [Nitrospiraceae bacterium]